MATTYKIELHGIKLGADAPDVLERVSALVKLPQERVMRLLMRPGVIVKRGLDAQTGAKYATVLDHVGCNVVLAPELPLAAASEAAAPAVQADSDAESAASTAAPEADDDEDNEDAAPDTPGLRQRLGLRTQAARDRLIAFGGTVQGLAAGLRARARSAAAALRRRTPDALESAERRPVNWPLACGIALVPPVFSWFTLRKGYSARFRAASFAWLGCAALVAGMWVPNVATAYFADEFTREAIPVASAAPALAQVASLPSAPAVMIETAVAVAPSTRQSEPNPCPAELTVAHWTNCHGSYTWPDGARYVGEYVDGRKHGRGTMFFASGEKYVGEFRAGKRYGQGTFTWPDGMKYVGQSSDDKLNGQGTLTLPSGEKYAGGWRDNQYHGQGTYTFADGGSYVGGWIDSQYHGQGTLILADGRKYVGEWKARRRHGQGTMTYADGARYVGEWRDDKKHGQGMMIYADGRKYVGEWRNDKPILHRAQLVKAAPVSD